MLRLLLVGRRNREIAAALHVTENTVEYHVGRLLAKLGARSRGEAAARARVHGLRLWELAGDSEEDWEPAG